MEEDMFADGEEDIVADGDIENGGGTRDGFTEVTYVSWLDRMKQSFTGVCIGLLLFFGSFTILVWNESRAVSRQRDLDEGNKQVHSYSSSLSSLGDSYTIDASRAGSLIHIIAPLYATDKLIDPVLKVETSGALKYRRNVEMYQWSETSRTKTIKTSNGGTRKETTYDYQRVWSSRLINSGSFRRAGYDNPSSFPIEQLFLRANEISLGPFALSEEVVGKINWYTDLKTQVNISDITDSIIRSKAQNRNGKLYISSKGNNSTDTSVGDARVDFDVVLPATVSIVAKQGIDGELSEFSTSRGGSLLLFQRGAYSSDELFNKAEDDNTQLTWTLRFVGFLVMFVGVLLVLQPMATFVDVIPFVGDCMAGGLQNCIFPLIAFIICVPLALFTIALAWVAYRPAWAASILAVTGIIVAWFVKRSCDKKKAAETNNKLLYSEHDAPPPAAPIVEEEPSTITVSDIEPEIDLGPHNPDQEPEINFSKPKLEF